MLNRWENYEYLNVFTQNQNTKIVVDYCGFTRQFHSSDRSIW